ncbi:MAG: hypothetical protein KF693_16375 [Nitrospira sp.]|nr:hypothetical protein [Nitrospira sp.]
MRQSSQGFDITKLGALLFAKCLDEFNRIARKSYAVAFDGLEQFIGSQTSANEVIEQALRREVRRPAYFHKCFADHVPIQNRMEQIGYL